MRQVSLRKGWWLAKALEGAWRPSPPPLDLSAEELRAITPDLMESGAAGLVWRRIRESPLRTTASARRLYRAYRFYVIRAAVQDTYIRQVLQRLRSVGVEPLLGKGWAAARLYPEVGLRPYYTDIDLYLRPEEYPVAKEVLRHPDAPPCAVDLHEGCPDLEDRSIEELYRRSRWVSLGEVVVRVLGPEDHLRLLCIHTLRHGAHSLLSWCDIGAAFETRPSDFDWDYFWTGNPRRTEWVLCALHLAHRLLGMEWDGTPVASRIRDLPGWLIPTVLRHWQTPGRPCPEPLGIALRRPALWWRAIRDRWPDPIEATVAVGGAFDETPRILFQVADCLVRAARWMAKK